MNNHIKRPAIFLDRDGTLIEEVNFLSRVEDLRLYPFTLPALESLKRAGYLLIVVTNQSGIGRGIYDEDAMHAIHNAMQSELDNIIDAFYFCPHLPCDGCACRKPGLGMIEAACRDFPIDIGRSWMVGDKNIDIELGLNAGTSTILVRTGYGTQHQALLQDNPDFIARDFGEAHEQILLSAEVVL